MPTPPLSPLSDPFRTLTPERRKALLSKLRKGLSRPIACGLIGLSVNTLKKAIEQGSRAAVDYEEYGCPLTPHAEFYYSVMRAEALALAKYQARMDAIVALNPLTWAAGMTVRERLQPETFGRRQAVQVEQNTKVQIEFVERDGQEWLSGGAVTIASPVLSITSGEESIIDTEFVEDALSTPHDDNDF